MERSGIPAHQVREIEGSIAAVDDQIFRGRPVQNPEQMLAALGPNEVKITKDAEHQNGRTFR